MKLVTEWRSGMAWALAATAVATPSALHAEDIIPPKIYTLSPGGVNLSDASLMFTVTDLSIGTLTLERYHVGGHKLSNTPMLGGAMSHQFDIFVDEHKHAPVNPYILPDRYKPIVHMGTSASGTYRRDLGTDITWASSRDAESGTLTYASGAYTYITQDGTIYTFDPNIPAAGAESPYTQRVSTITYPSGRKLILSYDASKQLKLISDNSGYAIVFDYDSSGLVSAACGFNLAATYVTASTTCTGVALKVTYGHPSNGLTVTDPLGQTTTYTTSNSVYCIKPPGYSICKLATTYNSSGYPWLVVQQTFADGTVWNYAGGGTPNARTPDSGNYIEPNGGMTYTDPNGKLTAVGFSQSSPFFMTDPLNRTTEFRYTGGYDYESSLYSDPPDPTNHYGSLLIEATYPEGNKYLAEYNGPYNSISKQTLVAKPGSGLPDRTVTYTYDCPSPTNRLTCAKPVAVTDSLGNTTNFTYASHGGQLSEMKPAPTTGAARPLKLSTWLQKYAYVKNSGGTLVTAPTPIWLIASETECQTVAGSNSPVCDTGAMQKVTTYEYGANGTANNLNVRAVVVTAGSTSRRSCFAYDNYGNKVSQTLPRAGLASCP